MAGIGDSWGTREELLHPRDSHGRFRSKWKMSPSVLAAVEKVLGAYHPRFFQSDSQATQYTNNLGHKKPGRFGGGKGFARLQADFDNANQDLRDGKIDEPSTKKFVDMMDASMQETPEDLIINHVATADAFGLTSDRLPELEELTGNVIADRGYLATNLGTPAAGGQGIVQMRIAAPKGTRVAIPASSGTNRAIFIDRDQEFTVTKVKPDGRGGYIMSVVATPRTPGETPLPEAGHQGSGMPENREANIKKLEDAASARETGSQPLGALPGEQAETPPAGMTPEQVRAQRRAAVLGRGPATAQPAQPAAAGPAPATPPAGAPETPNVPTPVPAETPQTPPAPETPNGATSVVTGEPTTSFREAVTAANLEAPSAGPRRREWNSAYQGVLSGKQHPQDMLRELEADIATNKKQQTSEPGRGDSLLADDIAKQEKLADLIQSHFNLGEPKQRQAKMDVRNELDAKAEKAAKAALTRPGGGTDKVPGAKKTAAEAARPGPLAKVAPKRTDGTPESRAKGLGDQQAKDLEDDRLNEEQRKRWSDALGADGGEPKEMRSGDTAGSILLDETADLLRNGRVTRTKAATRLRDQAGDDDTPEANYLRLVADTIESDLSKPAKRVPLKKRAPKAAPDVEAAQQKLAGRTDKNILTGLNGLTVGDLRALGDEWGVETRGEDKKLKLKAALAKELAAKWKSDPKLQRKGEGTKPEVASEAKLAAKKAAPAVEDQRFDEADLLAPEDQKVYKRLRKQGLSHQEAMDGAIEGPVKKAAAKKLTSDAEIQAGEEALAKARKTIDNLGKPKTPAAKQLAAIAEAPDTPAIIKKAAAKAAVAEPGAKVKKTARTELTKKQRDDNLPELSDRVLAGEAAHDVINDIRVRNGLQPQERAVVPTEKLQGPDEVMTRLQDFDNPPSREEAAALLAPFKRRELVEMAKGISIPGASSLNMKQLREQLVEGTAGRRLASISTRGFRERRPGSIDVPTAPGSGLLQQVVADLQADRERRIPGVTTASRAKSEDRAREVLADLQAPGPDPLEQITPIKTTGAPAKAVKAIRTEVEQTKGPKGLSVEDRVAAHVLARMRPDVRESVLADMSDSDRKHVLETAAKVALEQKRVKKGGFDLDQIMAENGLTKPADAGNLYHYNDIKTKLANGDTKGAMEAVKERLKTVDQLLDSARRVAGDRDGPPNSREQAGKEITRLLGHSAWLQAVGGALHDGNSPELITRQEVRKIVKQVAPDDILLSTPVDEIKQQARDAGIKLPESATTRDEVLTELTREMARRQLAGNATPLAAPKKVAKKAAPKPPPAKVNVRELAPELEHDDMPGSSDSRMLDTVQQMLDGDAKTLTDHGLPKTATPAAIGRYLERWNNSAGGPGWAAATNVISIDGWKRRISEADTPELLASAKKALADAEAERDRFRAQHARWKALAERLKSTRRGQGMVAKKTSPAAKADVAADLGSPVPAKKVAAAPERMTPTEAVEAGVSQVEIVRGELPFKKATAPISSKGFTGDAAAVARIVESSRTPVKETLARAAQSTPAKKAAVPEAPSDRSHSLETFESSPKKKVSALKPGDRIYAFPGRHGALATPRKDDIHGSGDAPIAIVTGRSEDGASLNFRWASGGESSLFGPSGAKLKNTDTVHVVSSTPAKATAKKVAKAVSAPTAGNQTRQELMDGPLSDLVDLEADLNIKRGSLQRSDRVDAIMAAREAAAAPAKKAAKKAVPSAAAAEVKRDLAGTTSGPPVRNSGHLLIDGQGRITKVDRTNADEPIHLPNAGNDQGLIHMDSELGRLWGDLYMDQREPNSFINEIARMGDQMGRNKLGLQQFIDRLKVMKTQAADKAIADRIQEAIDKVDAPPVKVDLPDDTPAVLRKAIEDLAEIPTARKKVPKDAKMSLRIGTGTLERGEPSIVEKKEDILHRLIGGDPALLRMGEAERELAKRDFHEGTDAATTMWDIMEKATSDPTVKKWLREKMLEARKKHGGQ